MKRESERLGLGRGAGSRTRKLSLLLHESFLNTNTSDDISGHPPTVSLSVKVVVYLPEHAVSNSLQAASRRRNVDEPARQPQAIGRPSTPHPCDSCSCSCMLNPSSDVQLEGAPLPECLERLAGRGRGVLLHHRLR